MCASPQASAAGTGKLRLGQASCGGAVWASYRAKGCVDGHCVQLGALAWGWPPAWQPLPLWPRPRAVARWPSPPCAQLKLPARQPQPNRRQAAHAVLRWRLRRGPSSCRRLSRTLGTLTLSSFQVVAMPLVDQVEQFLRALRKRGASLRHVQLLAPQRLGWHSRAHRRVAYTPCLAPVLRPTSLTSGDALKAASATASRDGSSSSHSMPRLLTTWRCLCLHTSKNATYIEINRFLNRFALYKVLEALFTP